MKMGCGVEVKLYAFPTSATGQTTIVVNPILETKVFQ
jgi:hypothetical protein